MRRPAQAGAASAKSPDLAERDDTTVDLLVPAVNDDPVHLALAVFRACRVLPMELLVLFFYFLPSSGLSGPTTL